MAGGLAALLDDISLIARAAAASVDDIGAATAKASAKAAGVVVDDAAVTPRYVSGVTPARELPIIWRIARGSLINKLLLILPVALLLTSIAPWVMTPILMIGGTYLCFEGAEKIYEHLAGHDADHGEEAAAASGPEAEKKLIRGAITTDLILSAEIMIIALNEVLSYSLLNQALILTLVGVGITALVYGAVALLVKLDDMGLRIAQRDSAAARALGTGMVAAMPKILTAISVIGVFAMVWVGGHILLVGLNDLGWHAPYNFVHHMEHYGHGVPGIGGFLAWCINTVFSLLLGVLWGGVIVAVLRFSVRLRA